MKPFDLEAAMRGEPIVARDGRKAKFIAHVPEAKEGFQVLAFTEGDYCCYSYAEDGKHIALVQSTCDLFMYEQPMLSINGHNFPEPAREPLKHNQKYWAVELQADEEMYPYYWEGDKFDHLWLKRGLIQLTREGAEAQYKAMISAFGGEE